MQFSQLSILLFLASTVSAECYNVDLGPGFCNVYNNGVKTTWKCSPKFPCMLGGEPCRLEKNLLPYAKCQIY
ncbi:unnamed protein product [Zymoseptoria tritici ST99CH_1A5]|uniref:Uncharacterized protein n=2 Tax=Zymoseptoria tritici TaxID=1047171 RepID=A0A2H1H0F2_ZYMTR|nr:unnamed protein product [Zymoseptoria tritici ST99CH_1E4]SMY28480.1 unnamed protein product [Zymoseptoria tritici ST99CH_1A5]